MKTRNLNFLSNRRFAAVLAMVATALIAYAQEAVVPSIENVTQRTAMINARTNAEGTNVKARGLQICEFENDADNPWETIDYAGGDEPYTYRKEGLRVDTRYEVRTFIVPESGDTIFSANRLFSTKDIEIFTDSIVSVSQTNAVLYGRISKGDDTADGWRYHVYKYKPGYWEGDNYIRGSYPVYEEMPITQSDTAVVIQLDGLENGTIYGVALSACNSKGERVMSHTYKYEDRSSFWKAALDKTSSPATGYTTGGWMTSYGDESVVTTRGGDIVVNVNLSAPVVLSFDWEVGGNNFLEKCKMRLFVDNMENSVEYIEAPNDPDNTEAEHIERSLEAGKHTIKWNVAANHGDSKALLSNIKFGADYQYFTTKEFMSNLTASTTAVTASLLARITETDENVTEYGFEYKLDEEGGEFISVPGHIDETIGYLRAEIAGLKPNGEYIFRGYAIVDGKKHYTQTEYMSVQNVSIAAEEMDVRQTSAAIEWRFYTYDATYVGSGIEYGTTKNYGSTIENLEDGTLLTELDPGTTYYYNAYIETAEGGRVYRTGTFTTKEITLTTLPVSNVSNRSATFNGTVECDTCSSAVIGFQWKTMTGWLSDPRFTEGVLTGGGNVTLGLTDGMLKADTDYQYRTAVKYKDKFYYSDWQTFRTELEFVAWPPTVGTMYRTDSDSNRIVLCGYIVPGSEAVTEYGYEYWRAETRTRAADVTRVVTGPDMVYTLDLTQLEAGDYRIRAYAKTASGTQYGETLTFSVDVMSGISSVGTSLPVCRAADGKLLIANAEGMRYYVADLSGRIVAAGTCASSTESVSLGDGIYVVRIDGGHVFKVMVR